MSRKINRIIAAALMIAIFITAKAGFLFGIHRKMDSWALLPLALLSAAALAIVAFAAPKDP